MSLEEDNINDNIDNIINIKDRKEKEETLTSSLSRHCTVSRLVANQLDVTTDNTVMISCNDKENNDKGNNQCSTFLAPLHSPHGYI